MRACAPSFRTHIVALDDSLPKSGPFIGETFSTPDQSPCTSEATSRTSPSETVSDA